MPVPRSGKVARGVRSKRALGQGYIRISEALAELIEDPSSLDEWDDEELRAGCRRNRNGRFPAAQTQVIPRVVYDKLMSRTIDECLERMRRNMPEMIDIMMVIIRDPGVMAKDKLKAIDMMMNRVFGKPTERHIVQVGQEKRAWQKALDIAIVSEPDPTDEEEFE